MRAIRLHEFGGPDVLRLDEVPVPEPAAGEVLVRVRAVGINPPDWYVRDGMPSLPPDMRPPLDLPLIPGTDVSGVVVSVAAGVEGFAPGDEVFGMLRFPGPGGDVYVAGAYAEYVAAPVSDLAHKAAHVDHVQAAGVAMSGLTAYQYLVDPGPEHPSPFQAAQHRPVALDRDTTVLVNGAAGGVGHLGLQIAKAHGARVVAVASGRHEQFLTDLGADEFVDYTRTRPEEVVHDVDLVLDTVGGSQSRRLLPTLRRGGALFPVFLADLDPDEVAGRGVTISGTQVQASGTQMAELGRALADGTLRVAVAGTFPLADAPTAHEVAGRGHLQGKLVLTVD